MALVYRGFSGSQPVFWLEGAPTPNGLTNISLVGEANTVSGSSGGGIQVVSVFTNSWTTVYTADFNSFPTQNVYGNTPISINGVNWQRINPTYSNYMSYSGAGRGLEIRLTNVTSDYWGSTRTMPAFVLPLSEISSIANTNNMKDYDLRFIVQLSCSSLNSNEQGIIAIENNNSLLASSQAHIEAYYVNSGAGYLFGSGRTLNNVGVSKNISWTSGVLDNIVSLQFDESWNIDFLLSSSINSPNDYSDFATSSFVQKGRMSWSTSSYDAGMTSFFKDPKYTDFNLVLGAKAWSGGGDGIINILKVIVQTRPKTVISSQTGSYRISRINAANYTNTTAVVNAPQEIGAFYFVPQEHNSNVYLRTILSTVTTSNKTYLKLWNTTNSSYVHIGGPGVTELTTSNPIPSTISSVNLATATNFSTITPSTYIVHLYGSGSFPLSQHYNTELVTY